MHEIHVFELGIEAISVVRVWYHTFPEKSWETHVNCPGPDQFVQRLSSQVLPKPVELSSG